MSGIQQIKPQVLVRRSPVPGNRSHAPGLLLRQTIEQRILPHLLGLHPPDHDAAVARTPGGIAALAQHAASGHPEPMFARVAALLHAGMTPETLCLDVLAPAARHLGELWMLDECDFIDVTIGVARLQQALHLLSPMAGAAARRRGRQPSILMVPVPGEQHSFGLNMAADFFRRAGWNVASGMSPRLDGLQALVRARHFDVVGFSASCDRHAEMLARGLHGVRQASINTRVVTMVGGPLCGSHPGLVTQLGADAVVTDGSKAPALAALLLRDQEDQHTPAAGHAGPAARMTVPGELQHSDRRASSSANGDRVRQSRSRHHQENRVGGI